MNPEDLRYTEQHEWVRMEGELATVGITRYAQEQLGDVVYVELPPPGKAVEQHQPFGSIDSVKTASDLYSPLSGVVVEVNEGVNDDPALVNADPYDAGWMIKVRPANPSDVEGLMTEEQYAEFTREL